MEKSRTSNKPQQMRTATVHQLASAGVTGQDTRKKVDRLQDLRSTAIP